MMDKNFTLHKSSSMNKADVDILLLSFNSMHVTKDFVKCLYSNTDPTKFRLVWLDNGSSDGTVEYLKDLASKESNMSLLLSPINLGVINGRNAIVSYIAESIEAPSDYLMFLDNDQFVQTGWLPHHMLLTQHGYDIVGVEAWQMSNTFLPVKQVTKIGDHFNYVGCGGSVISRKVIDSIGMYDPQFNPSYFEDPDFCFRAHEAGFRVGWNWKAKITHMPHQTLGKMGEEKNRRFLNSLKKFRMKWKGKEAPVFVQKHLNGIA